MSLRIQSSSSRLKWLKDYNTVQTYIARSVFLCLIVTLLVIPSIADPLPSAKFLLDAWQTQSSQVVQNVSSYELNARGQDLEMVMYSSAEAAAKGPALAPQPLRLWHAINSKDGCYIWEYKDVDRTLKASFDGKQWYYLQSKQGSPPQLWKMTDSGTIEGDSIQAPFLKDGNAFPFTLRQWIDDPMHSQLGVPLINLIQANVDHMVVTGPELLAGSLTYHLHLSYKSSVDIQRQKQTAELPSDIWLSARNNVIIPQKLVTYYGAGRTVRKSVTVTGWDNSTGVFLPTGFTIVGDNRSPGKVDWVPLSIQQTSLAITKINHPFPVSTFQLNPKASDDFTLNGIVQQKPNPRHDVNTAFSGQASYRYRSVVLIFVLFITGMLFWFRRSHR